MLDFFKGKRIITSVIIIVVIALSMFGFSLPENTSITYAQAQLIASDMLLSLDSTLQWGLGVKKGLETLSEILLKRGQAAQNVLQAAKRGGKNASV